jgi:hypothetical protein
LLDNIGAGLLMYECPEGLSVMLNKSFKATFKLVIALTLFNVFVLTVFIYSNREYGSASYSMIAENLLQNGKYSLDGEHYTFYRPPLFPLMLFCAKYLGGDNWILLAKSIMCLMSIVCGVLVYMIANRISQNEKIGYLATSLYILHLTVQAEHYALRETLLFELLLLTFVYIFVRDQKINMRKVVYATLLTTGLYLTRPTGFVFVFLTVSMVVLSGRSGMKLRGVLTSLVLFLLLIAPWQYYHYKAFSKITLWSSNSAGANLYVGASPAIQGIYPQVDTDEAAFFVAHQLRANGIDANANEDKARDFLLQEAKRFIKANPVAYAKGMALKFIALYSPVRTPLGTGIVKLDGDELVVERFEFSRGILSISHFFITILLIPFGFYELIRFRGKGIRERRFKVMAIFVFAVITALHMLSFAETRFRLPFDCLLCIATAIFLYRTAHPASIADDPIASDL